MSKAEKQTDVRVSAPPLQMPNAASTAEDVTHKALDFCARKIGVKDPQDVIDRLRLGDSQACEYCHYSLAEQIGAALGVLDANIKAAYMFECEATTEDWCFSEAAHRPLVHLLVWTHRKTEALNSLVAMLDRAITQSWTRLIGLDQLQHVLDVQIIDDADVERRVGYGALLHSLHHRPLKVWEHT
jgi:hypothetical protein